MSLIEQIEGDVKEAMKSGDSKTRDVLRLLLSNLKNLKIQKREELTDTEIITQLNKERKTRQESIDQFLAGGRGELAEKEKEEIQIIEKYLPEQLSEEELERIVNQTIQETNAQSISDMGKVMSKVMEKVAGKADGSAVSQLVKQRLING